MKIHTHVGDLLEVNEGIIVHGCNAQGVMNSGIAKVIREKYPQVYTDYKSHERRVGLRLGDIIVTSISPKLVVISLISQEFYGTDKSKVYVNYEAIKNGFSRIKNYAESYGHDVHFPLIGCGLANGKWELVEKIIETSLGPEVRSHLWVLNETKLESN